MAIALAAATGCSRSEEPPPASAAPVVEPVFPSLSSIARADSGEPPPGMAPWTKGLPAIPVPVPTGQRAWAVTPIRGTELARVAIYTVGHVDGLVATVTDAHGQRIRNVPTAMIHPLGPVGKLKPGDPALAFSAVTSLVVGRVSGVQRGAVRVQYDWAGATRTMTADHAQPLGRGIEPMGFVGYPKFGRSSRGLVLALSSESAWIQTTSGHVEVHPRSSLERLELPTSTLGVGDPVEAYGWTTGYERGKVARILEPELRFAVELPASRLEHPFFFADLRLAR